MRYTVDKTLACICIIVLLGNIITTTAYGVIIENKIEEDKIIENNPIENSVDNDEIIDNEELEESIEDNIIDEIVGEEIQENIVEQTYDTVSSKLYNEKFSVSIDTSGNTINAYYQNEIYYLFVPQGLDIHNLTIHYTGNVTEVSCGTIDNVSQTIQNDFTINDTISIIADNENYLVKVMQSDLPSMYISLNDVTLEQINQGTKDIKYSGNTIQITETTELNTNTTYNDVEIKGRGNFTWKLDKKSYQIKFKNKESLFGMNKAKKWILLANHTDASLMRNEIAFDLSQKIGLPYPIKTQFVDLWVDGDYIGNYMICEKAEIGSNRINLKDQYGVMIEIDNTNYGKDPYFISKISDTAFALKESTADDVGAQNSVSMEAFKNFENYINEFEKALYAENKDWDKISSMIDVESFIKFYFIQEFTEDPDGCRSSMYMYKDGENDVIHMGPVWDYDSSLGNYAVQYLGGDPNTDYVAYIKKYMGLAANDWFTQLFKIREFREEALEIYENDVKEPLDTIHQKIEETKLELNKSADMNFVRWNFLGHVSMFGLDGHAYKKTYQEEVEHLSNWVDARISYLSQKYSSTSNIKRVAYSTHVEDYGWDNKFICIDGETSGTTGKSKKIEAIRINLDSFNDEFKNASIEYRAHVEGVGWMDWVKDGEMAGTSGQSKRLEAIQIKLNDIEGYKIEYRVHVEDIGWMDWVKNGEIAGTTGKAKRIEAIQIRLKEANEKVFYNTHIQDIGWEKHFSKYDGQLSGTTGMAKRLEAIKIKLGTLEENDVNIAYKVHVEDIGWMDWVKDGKMAGTSGKAKRIESIVIKLENSIKYTVQYRVHIQDQGWTDWISEGKEAGTTGKAKRLEAIEIQVVEK